MTSLGLIVSSHDGTFQLDKIASWIANQSGWRGVLIVIVSGKTEIEMLEEVCKENNINLVFEKSVICPLAKRNRGAAIAKDLDLDYVAFMNDYQSLTPGCLKGVDGENHSETILFGSVQFDTNAQISPPPISQLNFPLSKKSSRKEIWAIFSSVSEAGILVKTDFFASINGWRYPTKGKMVCLGGDGMHLVARTFTANGTFGFSENYQVLGGHKNTNISSDVANSRRAMYPYAFTLSTKIHGIPFWLAPRFILGRCFRFIQDLIYGNHGEIKSSAIEIASRVRAYFNFSPSTHSSLLTNTLDENCETSQFICAKQGATLCRFSRIDKAK